MVMGSGIDIYRQKANALLLKCLNLYNSMTFGVIIQVKEVLFRSAKIVFAFAFR